MKKTIFVLSILMASVLLFSACAPVAAEPEEVAPPAETPAEVMESDEEADEMAPPAGTPEAGEEEEGAMMMEAPYVEVNDQTLADGTVTIAGVGSDGPGWIVIHADDGGPGPVVGYAAVTDGNNTDVVVEIDTEAATETLYAMLHTDAGVEGTYEFPGDDGPVSVDGSVVVQPFTATAP